MKISDETTAREAIDMWRSRDSKEQLRQICLAIETLELNQLYYESKGNNKGIIRSENAINMLIQRRTEIESELVRF